MKNEKYLVIEKEILERLLKEYIEKMKSVKSDISSTTSHIKWLDGNIHALETVKHYCKPLDETI